MGSFRQSVSKSDPSAAARLAASTAVADATQQILYDPGLIDSLLRDHAELGLLFRRIGDAGTAGNAGEARSLLTTFKARLKAHVVAEDVRFYDYLEQAAVNDAGTLRVVRRYRREMAEVAHRVFTFVDTYQSSMFEAGDRARFARDFKAVERALEHRLDSEEDSLYRLYRPG